MNPNLKSQIYIAGIESAKIVPLEYADHALDTAGLEAFDATGLDKADYPFWLQTFTRFRGELMQCAAGKAQSELNAEAAAKAAKLAGKT